MIHSREQEILEWLVPWVRIRDMVFYNALNNHRCKPSVTWNGTTPVVTATSRSGRKYRVAINMHPVTMEPCGFGRLKGADE